MDAGTVTGQAYAAGLSSLKGNMDQLAHTAAVSVLGAFDDAIQSVNQHMPSLNRLTGEMGSALGGMVSGTLNAFLTGLERATPLIEAGAVQLSHFVGWLDSFATSQGFGDFLQYAEANLPAVVALLENLVTTSGHILAAFAPLGPGVVAVLSGISSALNALPLPVLAGLVAGAVAVPAAFSLARAAVSVFGDTAAISALKVTVFGTAVNLAVPVVGILTAALAALTIGTATAMASQKQLTISSQDFADAVKKDNDAIGENVRLKAQQVLIDQGIAQAAARQGISLKTLWDATTGNADASRELNGQLEQMNAKLGSNRAGQDKSRQMQQLKSDYDLLSGGVKGINGAISDEIDKQRILNQMNGEASTAIQSSTGAYATYAGQLGMTSGALLAAMDAQDKHRGSADAARAAMQLENDAAGILKGTLDQLNGKALSAAQAQNAFDSSLANMGDHVDKTGKVITFTTTSINDMSAASVALRGQLNSQVANLQQVVEANGGLANSTGKAREQMMTMRQQIIDNAVAHGVDRDAVTAYIDKILQIPASVPPTKLDVDNANALAKVQALQAALDSLHGKEITNTIYNATVNSIQGGDMGTNATTNGNVRGAFALGGTVGYLAGGGMHPDARGTDTVPAMLTKNEFVIRQSSANALRNSSPGALEYINRHGQLPPQQQAAPVINPNFQIFIGNQELDSRTYRIAQTAMEDGWADASRRRIGA